MRFLPSLLAACMLIAVAAPASAANRKNHDDCNTADPDRNIAGCTIVAEDTRERPQTRANAYVGRGLAWRDKGNLDRAIADFTVAISLNPKDALAYNDRGLAWNDKGNHERAIADFSDTIRLAPEFANAYYGRAQIYMAEQDPDSAIADLNAAIRLAPDQPYVYYLRGAAWYDRYMRASDSIEPKDLTRAIADFTKAIHYGPYFAGAYYARGLARSTNGEHDRAVEDFAQAVRLEPNNPQMAAALKRLMP